MQHATTDELFGVRARLSWADDTGRWLPATPADETGPASPLGLEMDGMAAPLFNVQDAVVAPLPGGLVLLSSLPLDDASLGDDDVDEKADLI